MTTTDLTELAAVMEQRAFAYRFLSRAFIAAPDAALLDALLDGVSADEAEDALAEFYAEARDGDREQLRTDIAADYNQLFLGMSAHPVAPYESVYTSEEGLLMQEARDEALAAYRTWGLAVPDSFDLPEDHVALELELMALLADRTAEAARAGNADEAAELVAAQRAFADEHLAWVAPLADDVQKHARTAFYYGVAALARDTIAADRELLAEL